MRHEPMIINVEASVMAANSAGGTWSVRTPVERRRKNDVQEECVRSAIVWQL